MYECVVIGISDSRQQWFPPHVERLIAEGRVFSGGKRHHEIMRNHLPSDAEWIDITVPISQVFQRYEQYSRLIIFASGDPLFYGFAATIQRECPKCRMQVYPSFNSLQMLAHRMCLSYQNMRAVSLTGRPWDKFDEALIRGEEIIGVLTDHHKTPQVIWQRMLDYGYDNYQMTVGENLGNEELEHVGFFEADREYAIPNCLILQRRQIRPHPFGIPENDFALLDGRVNMITKAPIRLLTLSALELGNHSCFWDIGFCTGSVSIEARLQFPHLRVEAFEIRSQGEELMRQNSHRFGVPGIGVHMGDFLQLDLSGIERPDAVFIGGHGGRLVEVVRRVQDVLLPGGVLVFNSVSQESQQVFRKAVKDAGMHLQDEIYVAFDKHNPITIMSAK